MKTMHYKTFALSVTAFFFLVSHNSSIAQQSTWSTIHNIFQGSCAGSSCHSNSAPHPLKLVDTETIVYSNLIDIIPTNTDAASGGQKLVDPGHPHSSFLLKKVNNGLDSDNDLANGEGAPMPFYSSPLENWEIDLINVWILHGAPYNGTVVDTQLIQDFHSGMGKVEMNPLAPPGPNDGFQIHLGPVFLAPNDEIEYRVKHDLSNLPDSVEVTRLESKINVESHHYIMYKFNDQNSANGEDEGLREVGFAEAFISGTSMISAWQNSSDVVLPENTAFFWEGNSTLDLNLHIRNYDQDSILKAHVYTNVYTQPIQSETVEMQSDILIYSAMPIAFVPCALNDFCIPNDGQVHTFTGPMTGNTGSASPVDPVFSDASDTDSLYLFMLGSHTHKFGTDFDIYYRNPDGSKGSKVYEGFYNFDYSFNQGYYDFEDPAVRYFEMGDEVIYGGDGLIQEATFVNDSSVDVGFGLTTNDEMMLTYIQYTTERPAPYTPPVGVDKTNNNAITTSISPNPVTGTATISLKNADPNSNYRFELYDVMGKKVIAKPLRGNNRAIISSTDFESGIYLFKVFENESTIDHGKIVIQ